MSIDNQSPGQQEVHVHMTLHCTHCRCTHTNSIIHTVHAVHIMCFITLQRPPTSQSMHSGATVRHLSSLLALNLRHKCTCICIHMCMRIHQHIYPYNNIHKHTCTTYHFFQYISCTAPTVRDRVHTHPLV